MLYICRSSRMQPISISASASTAMPDAIASLRRHWLERWDHPANVPLVQRVQRFATTHGLTTREVNLAWLLNQPFPCIAVVPLPCLLMGRRSEYDRASQFLLNEVDRASLRGDNASNQPTIAGT